jgi:hypothetical protein
MKPLPPAISTAAGIPVRSTWTEGIMEAPTSPEAYAAHGRFAHRFSYGKEVCAASRMSRGRPGMGSLGCASASREPTHQRGLPVLLPAPAR